MQFALDFCYLHSHKFLRAKNFANVQIFLGNKIVHKMFLIVLEKLGDSNFENENLFPICVP